MNDAGQAGATTHDVSPRPDASAAITERRTSLGIELGSTRIKACLVDDDGAVLATGAHAWESRLVDGLWSYPLDEVWAGLQAAYVDLVGDVRRRHGLVPAGYGAIGVSAMMHGYLAFDADGGLLVPFRTWRNTNTGPAAAALVEALGINIPLRWSAAHLYQAALDGEEHVGRVDFVTTLAGYVHDRLTGRRVLGVGDAAGMFPIDAKRCDYDAARLDTFARLLADAGAPLDPRAIFPQVLPAGADAGALSAAGAALLDPTGTLRPGIPLAPPEGDAGTGMVATGAVAPGSGNISVGTSIFAMVVLDRPLARLHTEIDLVTTPAGAPVAMVHCNNGAAEIEAWATVFADFAARAGVELAVDDVYAALFAAALDGAPDAGGLVAYNYVAGEPITGLPTGRPVLVRPSEAELRLAELMRAQIFGVFGTLSLGMDILAREDVELAEMFAHGGMFRSGDAAGRLLAAALAVPVTVGETAAEGGAWGMALLASYLRLGAGRDLAAYVHDTVAVAGATVTVDPDPADVAGYRAFLGRYRAGLPVVRAAAEHL